MKELVGQKYTVEIEIQPATGPKCGPALPEREKLLLFVAGRLRLAGW